MTGISELEANRDNLIDIKDVHIATNLPATQRMEHYLEQVKNPYCFICGKTVVRISFSHSGESINESLKTYFLSLKST